MRSWRSPRATTSSRGSSCATGRAYSLAHGPFRKADFRALPARDWTLLVQGVNLHSDAADALLRRFAFVPYARLDDLMVSYAAPGGGVGPHFDSYDVFLLQGFGTPPLALRAPAGPRAAPRPAGEDPAPVRARARRRARPRRHAVPAARVRARRRRRRRMHDVLDRLSRGVAHRARAALSRPPARSRRHAGTLRRPGREPTREPARIAPAMQRRATQGARRDPLGPRGRRALPGRDAVGAQARRVLRAAARRRSPRARSPTPRGAAACASTGARNFFTMTPRSTSTATRAVARGRPRDDRGARERARARRASAWRHRRRTASRTCTRATAMDTSTSAEADPPIEPRDVVLTRSPRRSPPSTSSSTSRATACRFSTSISRRAAGSRPRAPRRSRRSCAAPRARGSSSSSTTRAGSRRPARGCSRCSGCTPRPSPCTGRDRRRAARWIRC